MLQIQNKKNKKILDLFQNCSTPKQIYKKIITLGAILKPLEATMQNDQTRVYGCQSLMYLACTKHSDEKLEFKASSNALISKGLAALMLEIYNFETASSILMIKPTVFQEMKLLDTISPARINGMKAFYLKLMSLAHLHLS